MSYPPQIAPQFVQGIGNNSGTTSVVKAFASNNTEGNSLIVGGGNFNGSNNVPTMSVSDSQLNIYYPVKFSVCTNLGFNTSVLYLWIAPFCAGGANTVTVTSTISGGTFCALHEYSGLDSGSIFDQTNAGVPNVNISTLASGNIVTNVPIELVIALGFDQTNNDTWTPTHGFTKRVNNGASQSIQSAELVVDATGTFSNTWTINNNSHGLHSIIASFKAAQSQLTIPAGQISIYG